MKNTTKRRTKKPAAPQTQVKRPAHRPSLYKPEYQEITYKLCLLRSTEAEMANVFGVDEKTFNRWKKQHPELRQSIARGREYADANVAERLYNRAVGYEIDAVKIFNSPDGPVYAPYREHIPADVNAASLWLRNRHRDKWRDRIEHTGADGGPISLLVERKLTWGEMSEAEIEAIEAFALAAKERRDAAQRTIEHRPVEDEDEA